MRPDMAKVVTERPRLGHHRDSLKTALRIGKDHYEDDDHGSARHPVSRHRQFGYDAKEFSDLLGPLRGYLRSQVGRPWNKIYSELSKTLDKRSLTGRHIWSHITGEVELNAKMVDGKIYHHPRHGWNRVAGLYVHPITGLLCYFPDTRHRFRAKVDPNIKKLDNGTELRRFDGIWYRVELTIRKFMRIRQTKDGKLEWYEDQKFAVIKKQLNRKELKLAGVVNVVV